MHGAWTFYRKDGSVMRTGSFRHGERTGAWRTFDRAGGMVRESSF
jgi:antitoxin component YwqK of YwqJK toxin-antitoxin module